MSLCLLPDSNIRRALFYSVSLHAALLLLFADPTLQAGAAAAPSGTLQAVLAGRKAESPSANKGAAPVRRTVTKSQSRDQGEKRYVRPQVATGGGVLPPAKPVAVAEASLLPGAAGVGVVSGSAGPVSGIGEALPVDGLRAYRLALGREARRLKLEFDHRYSRLESDLEGRVELNVQTDGAGMAVRLARSSGHAVLDQQAVELLGRAVGRTELPSGLLGRSFLLPVVLEFEIERREN